MKDKILSSNKILFYENRNKIGFKFRKIYKKATEQRYDFLYLDLQSNPARAFRNFEEQLAEGDRLLFEGPVADNIPE